MTTPEQNLFLEQRRIGQKIAEALGLTWYVANMQRVALRGDLVDGKWPASAPREARAATDEEVELWVRATGVRPELPPEGETIVTPRDIAEHILPRTPVGQGAVVAGIQMDRTLRGRRPLPNTNEIGAYFHCGLCLAKKPEGIAPRDYARLAVGWSSFGLQVWCLRHDCNVAHVDFQGMRHPANLTRPLLPSEKPS